jgi:hypothetical protein
MIRHDLKNTQSSHWDEDQSDRAVEEAAISSDSTEDWPDDAGDEYQESASSDANYESETDSEAGDEHQSLGETAPSNSGDSDHSSNVAQAADIGDDEPVDVIIEPDVEVEYEPLDTRWVAGIVASLVLHMWMVSTLSSVTIEDREYETIRPIESKIGWDEPEPLPFDIPTEYELANPNELEKEQQTALNARSVGLIQSDKPVQFTTFPKVWKSTNPLWFREPLVKASSSSTRHSIVSHGKLHPI